jgi:hypothetical protein
MSGELERARDKLRGEWKRADLMQLLDIKTSKASDLIGRWKDMRACERVPGTRDRWRWCEAAAAAADAAPDSLSEDTQTATQTRPDVRTPRPFGLPVSVLLGLTAQAFALVLAVVVVVLLRPTGEREMAQAPTVVQTTTPTQFPTTTSSRVADEPKIAAPVVARYAPDGDIFGTLQPGTAYHVVARYDTAWVQLSTYDGLLWVSTDALPGAFLPGLPDLRVPDPTATARVIVEQVEVPVYVNLPAQPAPPPPPPAVPPPAAPVPTAPPTPTVTPQPMPTEAGLDTLFVHACGITAAGNGWCGSYQADNIPASVEVVAGPDTLDNLGSIPSMSDVDVFHQDNLEQVCQPGGSCRVYLADKAPGQ